MESTDRIIIQNNLIRIMVMNLPMICEINHRKPSTILDLIFLK